MQTNLTEEFLRTRAGAVAQQVLRSCVHCGMCNATCPTYQLTGNELDGPRGRIYLLKQALEGQPVGAITQTHLDRCLLCRACETTCPSGVEYHKLYDVGREALRPRISRPWRERILRWLLCAVVPYPRRLRPLVALARVLKPVLPTRASAALPKSVRRTFIAPAQHARRMLLLTGCVQSVLAERFNSATVRVFDRLGIRLTEIAAVQCCGALHFHLDRQEQARELARRNIDAWWPFIEQGAEAIIVNASGCAAFLHEYAALLAGDDGYRDKVQRVAQMIRDPIEILGELQLRALVAPRHPCISVHDPCTLQHGLRLTGRIATLLRSLGFDPQPIRDAHLCCGSAGAYSLLQPEISASLLSAKVTALTQANQAAIYTANIGCWLHLQKASPIPVRHWIEAVEEVVCAPAISR
jgi:glycolate oxidase iron-sulfur subunit